MVGSGVMKASTVTEEAKASGLRELLRFHRRGALVGALSIGLGLAPTPSESQPSGDEDLPILSLDLSWERVGSSLLAEASILGAGVARVGFRVIDSPDVIWSETAPFGASIPVRADRYTWEVEARATTDDGRLVATAAAVISVLPKSPALSLRRLPARRPGADSYLADVSLSHGQTVGRIEVFLDGKPVGMLTAPPYTIELPAEPTSHSVLSARALMSTGDIVEDALLLGEGRGRGERLQIMTLEVPFRIARPLRVALDPEAVRITLGEERITPSRILFLESLPLQVQIALDASATMHEERGLLTDVLRTFVDEVIKPTDRVGVIVFDHRIAQARRLAAPSGDFDAGAPLSIGGGTAILDAIVAAVAGMSDAQGRRAVLVVSDGLEEHSRTPDAYVMELLARARVALYFLHLNNRSDLYTADGLGPGPILHHLGRLRALWKERALSSGGSYCFAGSTGRVRGCLEEFEAHLRATYLAVAQLSEAQRAEHERGAIVGLEALDVRVGVRIRDQ
jgi:hypothetical protein